MPSKISLRKRPQSAIARRSAASNETGYRYREGGGEADSVAGDLLSSLPDFRVSKDDIHHSTDKISTDRMRVFQTRGKEDLQNLEEVICYCRVGPSRCLCRAG